MTKALTLCCVFGAASFAFTPLTVGAAPAGPPVGVAATASCHSAHVDAAVLNAAPVEMPLIAHEMGFSGTTYVQVDLEPSGTIAAARIARSSGNRMADGAAILATRWSTFRPESINCAPVGGSYLYLVDFDA